MATRREFLKCSGFATGALIPAIAAPSTKTYGCLTYEGWRAHQNLTGEHLHVYLDGEDVTDGCFEANDMDGYVCLYCRDREHHRDLSAKGAIHLNSEGYTCAVRLNGSVVIAPGTPLT